MFVRVAAGASATLGIVVLFGWAFDIEALRSIAPGLSTLKANTALCFVLSGAALWLYADFGADARVRAIASLLAGAAATMGLLTLFQYATGLNLGIDQLLIREEPTTPHAFPGRMSTITAFEFVTFAAALILSGGRSRAVRISFLALTTLGLFIGLLALIGYLYELPLLYKPVPQNSIALHTATGFVLLFLGTFGLRPDLGWILLFRSRNTTGLLVRWLLPSIVLIPLLLGSLILWGIEARLYMPRDGVALFALASIAALGGVVWAWGVYANRLGARLQRRDRVFQTVVETALDAFILMDERGCVVEWNPQAERMFGWERSEALNQRVADLIVPDAHRSAHVDGLARFLATGEHAVLNRRIEVEAARRNGGVFPAELMVLPVKDGDEWAFSAFVRDLSSVKDAEAQLRQAQKMEAVGQLTGGVAHDFNNLLTVILANAETLSEELAGNKYLLTFAEMTRKAAMRGAELTNGLLAFARRQPLEPKAVDIKALVSGMDGLLRRTLGEEIEVELVHGAGLWQAVVDPALLESSVLNLALNARDAMPDGGKLTIETGNAHIDQTYSDAHDEVSPGQYVLLCVTDTGVGMGPEILARAFEPYFTTKEPGKGTGIGLAMAFGFVKQSNGHIKIYSEVGVGTTVKIYLPRAHAGEDADAAAAAIGASSTGGDETILLVEDNDLVREHAERLLKALGYTVLVADRGAAALEFLEREDVTVDLLFTDVVMPGGMSGKQLADRASVIRPDLKVLYTSGYTENAIVHHGRLDPGVKLLRKPYGKRDLAARIRSVLDEDVEPAARRSLGGR